MEIDKKGVIFDKLTGEVYYDPKQYERQGKKHFIANFKNNCESAIDSFKKHVRYEKNDKPSLCDGLRPMTVAELYDYFVSTGNVPMTRDLSEEEFINNERNIDFDEAHNQYEDMDDLIEKKEYYDSLQNNSVLNKGGVKQSETTTKIKTDEVKQENNIQEKKE